MEKTKRVWGLKLLVIILMVGALLLGGCTKTEEDLFVTKEPEVVVQEATKPEEHKIIVEIKGHILNPGVYVLDENQRLNDLIILSGGASENANLRHVNLAMKIMDGDSFYIPSMDEEVDPMVQSSLGGGETKEGKINLNQASKEELMTVTGIGPATADNILAYREENGPFKTVEDLLQVNRIGEKTLDKIRDSFVVR